MFASLNLLVNGIFLGVEYRSINLLHFHSSEMFFNESGHLINSQLSTFFLKPLFLDILKMFFLNNNVVSVFEMKMS